MGWHIYQSMKNDENSIENMMSAVDDENSMSSMSESGVSQSAQTHSLTAESRGGDNDSNRPINLCDGSFMSM